jgi:hypothetical protein
MNGRALNEKAIEVSPSSSRVLDRAADILTPFPPSKNRPRPGDWTCPSCGFSNFQRRTACFRCSYPLSQTIPPADPNMGFSYQGYGPPMTMHHGGHHMGGGHGPGMRSSNSVNSLGASAPFRPGDWRCGQETCNYHNFAKNINCLRCGAPRANAAVVADASNFAAMNDPSFGMGGPSMGNTPGPTAFPPQGFGNAGFPGQQFGGPPSTYALPSGLAGAPSPYPPMGAQYAPNGGMHGSGFDSRTEAAFSGAGPVPQAAGGASFGNGTFDSNTDPFHFLGTDLGNMSLNDSRRNPGAGATKSPNN